VSSATGEWSSRSGRTDEHGPTLGVAVFGPTAFVAIRSASPPVVLVSVPSTVTVDCCAGTDREKPGPKVVASTHNRDCSPPLRCVTYQSAIFALCISVESVKWTD